DVLGIETSCDETSVAVVDGSGNIFASAVYSQIDVHKDFGGVVPELAARDHLERLPAIVDRVLTESGWVNEPSGLARIAVSRGPGLAGCLLVGTGFAEGLSAAWSVPVVGVNHLWGHVYAAFLTRSDLEPPLLALV